MASDPEKRPGDLDDAAQPAGRLSSSSSSRVSVSSEEDVAAREPETVNEKSAEAEGNSGAADAEPTDTAGPATGLGLGQPPLSRASSTRSRAVTIVPRSKRRGLLAQITLIPEVERPQEYSDKTKWMITLVVAVAASAGPVGSGIFYPALKEMSTDLHASQTVINLAVATYMLGMAIFPLWWSSFSEQFGRRSIYVISFVFYFLFAVLSAVSVNITMLIIMRILTGGAGASVQAVGAGTIADIWEPRHRGRAMGIFYLGPLLGPLFSPIIGGALALKWGWRSTMWFLAIQGGVTVVMILFCLPETLAKRKPAATTGPEGTTAALSRISTARSVEIKTRRAAVFLKRSFIDPLCILGYLRHPPIALTVSYAAVTFGALYVLNVAVQAVFSAPPYAFSEMVVGLLYIPASLGYLLASLLGGRWIDNIMQREARRAGRYDGEGRLVFLPEDRMRENAWLSASLFPAALVWFGWTAQRGVHWAAPSVANFFFGVGSMLVFSAATTMLTEFLPRRSSSGIAVNNFVRNIFSGVGGIVTQPLLDAMGGPGWLFTMLAIVAFVGGNASIWALRRWGPRWRKEMDEKLNHQD
ncbi:uncharacterized protein E0L32_000094 [Thyridium curvatum]|uniref:Major facilitator superfamily (MFS) profile domain-containing protein n=1 Tax=Thyridium curvatum TaxID=1093900 RepID=A0A507BGU5_9PEZI|nr:uncharacterized protein E0L32_000094 [Thyridium curvatum]TPX15760.1 hypothetical protein E0L32_000094 [Thyridium curvatum]